MMLMMKSVSTSKSDSEEECVEQHILGGRLQQRASFPLGAYNIRSFVRDGCKYPEWTREGKVLLNRRGIGEMGEKMGEKTERKVAKVRGDDHFSIRARMHPPR